MLKKDKIRLQELAKLAREIAFSKENLDKAADWVKHNDLQSGSRPMVFCDPENGWNEVILQQDLQCEDEDCRFWEFALLRDLFSATKMKDDKVLEPVIYCGYIHHSTGWGLESKHIRTEENGSYIVVPAFDDYQKLELMKFPEIKFDREATENVYNKCRDIFDGILETKYYMNWLWSYGLSNIAIELRGLENFYLDMYDHPEELKKLMQFLSSGISHMYDDLEKLGLLCQNIGAHYVGSGGFGFTNCLKKVDDLSKITTRDMWGLAESQETTGVSSEMFGEFIFPYQYEISKRFGLNCYGCCEALESRWDYVKTIPNLRRVSVSHWANAGKMSEQLGSGYVYSLKPSPSYLAVKNIDEDAARKELRDKIAVARKNNCHIEVIMKDCHTIGKNPQNVIRWVEIAREELER